MSTKELDTLEAMIDAHGLALVLDGIANVCGAKAEHVRDAWQDAPLARAWDKDAATIMRASAKVRVS